jgi:hypothetical protein
VDEAQVSSGAAVRQRRPFCRPWQESRRFPKLIPFVYPCVTWRCTIRLTAGLWLALAMIEGAFAQNDGAVSDLLEKRISKLAGPNAVDCGRVSARAEPKHATDCAIAANSAGKPFHVRFDMQGIDSYVAVAFVRLPDGTLEVLSYDSDPMGGGGRAHEMVGVTKCPAPVHLYVTGNGHLNCFPPKPSGPRDAMSPTFDPY